MNQNREKLLEDLLKQMACVSRRMSSGQCVSFDHSKLNKPHLDALFLISREEKGSSVKELAKALDVTSGAVTQIIDFLVAKGLVQRREDQKDRRILKIVLTKNAKNKFKGFKKTYFNIMNPMFKNLETWEVANLLVLLNKIEGNSPNLKIK